MEWKDIVTRAPIVIPTVLVIFGWFISKYLDEFHERLKMRNDKMERIVDALLEYKHAEHLRRDIDPNREIASEWHKFSILVQAYGTTEQRNLLLQIGNVQNGNVGAGQEILNELQNDLIGSIRKYLRIQ